MALAYNLRSCYLTGELDWAGGALHLASLRKAGIEVCPRKSIIVSLVLLVFNAVTFSYPNFKGNAYSWQKMWYGFH